MISGGAFGPVLVAAAFVVAQAQPPAPAPAGSTTPSAQTGSPPANGPASAVPAAPTAEPTPVYTYVFRSPPQPVPPTDVPAIAEIDLNANALTPPAPLHVRVLTSVAVVTVIAQTSIGFMTRNIPIPKAEPGLFLFDGYIPDVPFFLRNHTFNVQFIATTAGGRSANVSLPLRLN